MVLVVFMSCSIVMLTDNEQVILPAHLPQAFSPPVAGLAPRPPAPAPGPLPNHHLPLAGARLGCPVPAPDLAGVTSLVRSLGLSDASYYCLLHFFHSPALNLERLTQLWRQTLQHLFRRCLVQVNGRPVVLVDGLKRPKEGRKMPAVKSLHQESRCNAKASFIMGHSLQAVALLVQAAG